MNLKRIDAYPLGGKTGGVTVSDTFNMVVMLDWGTENVRWSLGGEIHSMPNESPLLPGILFNDPEALTLQWRQVLRHCAAMVPWHKRIIKPKVLAPVPLGSSGVEAGGYAHVLKQEALSVILCEAPVAAAMGCGYSEENEKPVGILELGAGFSQFAVIQQCGIRISASLRRGGRDLDAALKRHLKRQFHIEPSDMELSAVKHDWNRHETLRLGGIVVERDTVRQIYAAAVTPLVEALQDTLDGLTPEMSAILKSDGIQMTGGLSQMPRLSEYLTERTGFPFHPTKNPAQAVMRGLLEMQKSRPPKLWRRA